MMRVSVSWKKTALYEALRYVYRNPDRNLIRLMNLADQFSDGGYPVLRKLIREAVENPAHPYYSYLRRLFTDIDFGCAWTLLENFYINESMIGWEIQEGARERYACNIPCAIALDPTSNCNFSCKGCPAADDGRRVDLSLEDIDSVIRQGKELGVYFYIYTGGEPLLRKEDLIRISEMHPDCLFAAFTNGTLLDETFADELQRVKNLIPVVSLFEDLQDENRTSRGLSMRAVRALGLLRSREVFYGVSCRYMSTNYETVTSDDYYQELIRMGVYFVFYYHYMPVGNNADLRRMPTPEQRTQVYRRVRQLRAEWPLPAFDLQNDCEFTGGCLAGGRRFLHINANGDVNPCVFVQYSNANIHDVTLLEALHSPIFMAYHESQPFNDDMLRPCPMLENPDQLREIVKRTGAHSTNFKSPETVDQLCDKCDEYAKRWKPAAERLWSERLLEKAQERKQQEEERMVRRYGASGADALLLRNAAASQDRRDLKHTVRADRPEFLKQEPENRPDLLKQTDLPDRQDFRKQPDLPDRQDFRKRPDLPDRQDFRKQLDLSDEQDLLKGPQRGRRLPLGEPQLEADEIFPQSMDMGQNPGEGRPAGPNV